MRKRIRKLHLSRETLATPIDPAAPRGGGPIPPTQQFTQCDPYTNCLCVTLLRCG